MANANGMIIYKIEHLWLWKREYEDVIGVTCYTGEYKMKLNGKEWKYDRMVMMGNLKWSVQAPSANYR